MTIFRTPSPVKPGQPQVPGLRQEGPGRRLSQIARLFRARRRGRDRPRPRPPARDGRREGHGRQPPGRHRRRGLRVPEDVPQVRGRGAAGEEPGGRQLLQNALAVEKIHHGLYGQALRLSRAARTCRAAIFVCPVCGNTMVGSRADTCPICGTAKSRFVSAK